MAEKAHGRFIVFEGIDGSGKSTQIALLCEKLRDMGHKVYMTAEPTASVSGGMLRDALSGVRHRTPCELAALFLLDRINHNVNPVNGIEKMLGDGFDVISDRYYYSSLAYQGSETVDGWVRDMNLECPEIRRPDLCVFLDLTPDASLARIGKGRAVTEIYEEKDKLEATRKAYFEVFDQLRKKGENIKIIDADRAIEDIAKDIFDAVLRIDDADCAKQRI